VVFFFSSFAKKTVDGLHHPLLLNEMSHQMSPNGFILSFNQAHNEVIFRCGFFYPLPLPPLLTHQGRNHNIMKDFAQGKQQ
jgi:hypothetical protein